MLVEKGMVHVALLFQSCNKVIATNVMCESHVAILHGFHMYISKKAEVEG